MCTKRLFSSWAAAALLIAALAVSVSCSYDPERVAEFCQEIEDLPVTELTAGDREVIMETPGTILVVHGFGEAKLGSGEYLKVEERIDLPDYAGSATVLLNGWRVRYLGDDQHVRAFGTMIGKIRREGRQLVWNAIGLLRDNDKEEGYDWTYRFTVIAWNENALDVLVNHDDASRFCNADTAGSDNFYFAQNERTTTALSSFSSFIETPGFPERGKVAIIPRGFGFIFQGDDHCLLQAGYHVDHGESVIEQNKKYRKAGSTENPLNAPASRADSRFVSWDTHCILKDNDDRRDYVFGEMVSACAGSDVGVIQPPFTILPVEDKGWDDPCVWEENPSENHEVIIDQIPFEFAIPMLTGWQLGYGRATQGCDDENVKEMGIWIEDWSYVKNPASPGTMQYKVVSVLRDKDSDPGKFHRERVSVLGFAPVTTGGVPSKRVPDLIPFSPLGTDLAAFCRLEDGRNLLRVTVKNAGNGEAGASRTTVAFGNDRRTQETPIIPAGGSVDLLFRVPGPCFDPDCEFRILVDSEREVGESNEVNNVASGSCAG